MDPSRRRTVLRDANREPFDSFELVAAAAAIVAAGWLPGARAGWAAIAALCIVLLLLRRLRRGLRRRMDR